MRTVPQHCRTVSSKLRHYYIHNRKNFLNTNMSSTCLHNMMNFGPLTAAIGPVVWGTSAVSKFQRVSHIAFVTAATSLTGGQQNFARCLAVSWAGTLCRPVHFRGLFGALAPNGILSGAKFTLRPSLAFSCIGSVTARHSSSGRQPIFVAWYKEWNNFTELSQRATPIFGCAAITLGIGPHSSFYCDVSGLCVLLLFK